MTRVFGSTAFGIVLFSPGLAHATVVNVQICMEFQVDYVDDGGSEDWWTSNTNKTARGVQIRIVDDTGTRDMYLSDNTGCVQTTVDVTAPSNYFTLKARSKAEVNGIGMEAYDSDVWETQNLSTVTWSNTPANGGTINKILPLAMEWEALAVGTWVFNRNTFNITSGTSRNCCLDSAASYQPDGTCGSTVPAPADDYVPVALPVRFFAGGSDSHCGGSTISDASGVQHPGVLVNCARKWVLAHELGHVVVGMRMGNRDAKNQTAPLDGCMGDYENSSALVAIDSENADARGVFTKEYSSAAFREGWATFFAHWAWNSRTEEDCFAFSLNKFDFNLDGTIDADEGLHYDCTGTPYVGSDPSGVLMDDEDWLADLEAATGPSCDADSTYEANRSTVYDVAKMWWDLTERYQDPIDPAELADIHVDACPRHWALTDACEDGDEDDLPMERILFGAVANGYFNDVLAALQENVWHTGGPTCSN